MINYLHVFALFFKSVPYILDIIGYMRIFAFLVKKAEFLPPFSH